MPLTSDFLAIWGAGLSTLIAVIQSVRWLWSLRPNVAVSYAFTTSPDIDDEVTVVNLSAVPLQVSHWRLAWKPKFWRFDKSLIDVTPSDYPDDAGAFKVEGYSSKTLTFAERARFDTSHRRSSGRNLILTLYRHGSRWPITLVVKA